MKRKGIYRKYIKRALDLTLSVPAFVVLSPVLLVTGLLVRVKLGSPVVFKQARPGLNEKIFYLYKFRSMTNETGEDGRLLPDAQRLTKFGKFLRASSLDELLELVNIIKGDMSIVGPRPLSIYYLPHYPARYRRRHEVRPGLTGLAQANGRNNLPWDDRFDLDIKYIDELSFKLDAKVILDTALKVVKRADVSVRGSTKVRDYGPYTILKEEGNGGTKMPGMRYSEIGSYFWLDDQEKRAPRDISWLPEAADACFAFSGRNAIDIVLKDILAGKKIRKVFAPSYCCVSMLQSFIDRGLDISFYRVDFKDGTFTYELPDAGENDVVLIMSYFGLNTASAHEAVSKLKSRKAVVIEDITHSLLTGEPASAESDYLVASLRKWFPVPTGGWAGKRKGSLAEKPDLDSNHAVAEKIAGMKEKYDYLTGRISDKEHFLLAQAKFDNDLIHVDKMLKIDDTSLEILKETDIEAVIRQRRNNARVLAEGLKALEGDVMKIPAIDPEQDTPLFLPVFLENGARDALRKYLIEHAVYCPVHWPEVMGAEAGLRENELSLICDQRYTEDDMRAIVSLILDWHKNFAG